MCSDLLVRFAESGGTRTHKSFRTTVFKSVDGAFSERRLPNRVSVVAGQEEERAFLAPPVASVRFRASDGL